MEITVIHGVSHKGSTYNITKQIIENLSNNETVINEFFMPTDMPHYCHGCLNCVLKGEETCAHYTEVAKIVSAFDRADIIILDSPTYVMEMTGQLKAFCDHLAYLYMPHRPMVSMFKKVGIVVSTAAGAGTGRVTKSLESQLHFLGVPKVIRYGLNVYACKYSEVSEELKVKIAKDSEVIAKKAIKALKNPKPTIKMRIMFKVMKTLHGKRKLCEIDTEYWKVSGLMNGSPWKKK